MVSILVAGCGPGLRDLDAEGTGPETEGPSAVDHGADESGTGADESGTGAGDECSWQPAPLPGVFDPGPECVEFVSSEEVAPVTVRIVNDGAAAINLVGPSECKAEYIAVWDSAGQIFPIAPGIDQCTVACEGAMTDECGCSICSSPDTIALQPGRSYEFEWRAYVWQPAIQIPDACASNDCMGAQCSLRVPPAEGEVEFMVAIAERFECEDCECTPNEQGWCVLEAGVLTEPPQGFFRSVSWPPPCPLVELHIP